jgi:multidrug efflux system membrane fusion protein
MQTPRSPTAKRAGRCAALGVVLALLGACKEENRYVPPPAPAVKVSQPVAQAVTDYLEVTGTTVAFNAVDLVARVEGFLEEIKAPDGTFVKKGDVLFVIEQPPYQAKVAQAQGEVEQQQALLTQAESEYARQQRLVKQNATATADVEKWQAQQGATQAALDQAKANLQLAQIDLGYTEVTAPFDGQLTAHLVDPGALVGAGAPTKLASLVQLDPIHVYFNVSEREVLRIKEAIRAQGRTTIDWSRDIPVEVGLQTEDGYGHRGKLDYVAPELDPGTGTLTARAVLANGDHALLPGLFVRVRVPLRTREDVLVVPDRAIGSDQGGPYLLVVDAGDTVQQRPVETGALVADGMRVIEKGLDAQAWVVVEGIQRAVPGSKVAPERIGAERPAVAGDPAPAATQKP